MIAAVTIGIIIIIVVAVILNLPQRSSQGANSMFFNSKKTALYNKCNPNSPAKNLKVVYRAATKYALAQGEIDEETLIDQENFLNERIAEVG